MKIDQVENAHSYTGKTLTGKEVVEVGLRLNTLNETDLTFEMEDANRLMKTCSFNDIIASFTAFHNKITDTFKVDIYTNPRHYKRIDIKRIKGSVKGCHVFKWPAGILLRCT